jgi:hypothetical protein
VKSDVENEMAPKKEFLLSCPLSNRQSILYHTLRSKIGSFDVLKCESSDSLMNIIMQFRKICNHPDLFEKRPFKSPFGFFSNPNCKSVDVNLFPPHSPITFQFPRLIADQVGQLRFRHLVIFHVFNLWNFSVTEYLSVGAPVFDSKSYAWLLSKFIRFCHRFDFSSSNSQSINCSSSHDSEIALPLNNFYNFPLSAHNRTVSQFGSNLASAFALYECVIKTIDIFQPRLFCCDIFQVALFIPF